MRLAVGNENIRHVNCFKTSLALGLSFLSYRFFWTIFFFGFQRAAFGQWTVGKCGLGSSLYIFPSCYFFENRPLASSRSSQWVQSQLSPYVSWLFCKELFSFRIWMRYRCTKHLTSSEIKYRNHDYSVWSLCNFLWFFFVQACIPCTCFWCIFMFSHTD